MSESLPTRRGLHVVEAHRMQGYQGTAWPRLRAYRSQFFRGGSRTPDGRWVASWETASFHTRAITFEIGWWRLSIGIEA